MRHLDLFSGIGGFALAARWLEVETVGFCEIDPWARKVLQKNFPNVPIHDDVKTLKGNEYGPIDILTGGYPCQPFSTSGRRQGNTDDRHLWPQVLRIIQESRPTWVLCENVAGHVSLGLDEVCANLEAENYEVQPLIIPACAKDARHRRDRVWILAHSECWTRQTQHKDSILGESNMQGKAEGLADGCILRNWKWGDEPRMGRVANGVSRRLDRHRGLGNAIVPQVAYEIMKAVLFSHNSQDNVP